ncbi:MAG TPA: pitrilysin family protein [Gemmatimonadaceae bacterium]
MTASLPSEPLPGLDSSTVHRTVLSNGLTVLLRRDDSAPVVAVVTYVKAGYFDETDDIVGIAHVLEHMYFKGTERRGVGEISRETKAAGGYLNAGTIYDHTSYYTVLPASGFLAGLEVQADAYANSVIDAEELARELEVIIQEAKRKADNPSAVTLETLYELLFDRHRMRRWRIGREAGLRALGRAQLVRFYRNFYRPRNTILSIVGAIDPDDAMRHVERLYGALDDAPIERAPGPPEPDRRGFRCREWSGDIQQTQVGMGWRTEPTMHPDTPALDLAATVLGAGRASRLYRAVRERKLATSVGSFNYTPTELGVFAIHAEGPPGRAADAARAAWGQVHDLRERGVGVHELDRARRIMEARWVRRLETMEGQANHIAEWEALGDWQLGERYLERLVTTSAAQVTEVVQRYLSPDRAGIVVYRPEGTPALAESTDAMWRLLERDRPEPLPAVPPRAAAPSGVSAPTPRAEREEAGVRVYRTASGVPLLVRAVPGAPVAYLGVFALGGASEESAERAGITSLLVRTAVKGTRRRTAQQIAEDAELLGGSIAPSLAGESFGWTISVPSKYARAALDLLADVAQHATIPDDALETERSLAIADLAHLRDDMYRYPMRLLTEAAFRGHPYGIPASGMEDSLSAIRADEVRDWHRSRLLEAPSVFVYVGDGDPDEVAALAACDLAELRWREGTPIADAPWPAEPTQSAESREKAQTAIALAFPAPARGDDDRYVADLIAGIASGLGGRFFDELRDRQSLAYTVQAFASERRAAGLFVSYIATSPEKEEVARQGLLREFAKLRKERVSETELRQAQTYAIGTHAIRQQSGGAVLGDIVDAWLLGRGLGELAEFEERVRGVTPDDVQRVARRYFDEGRRVEGVVRGVGREV